MPPVMTLLPQPRIVAFAVALSVVLTVSPAAAQSTPPQTAPASEGWRHTLVLYGLGAGLSGETAVRGLEADVDVGFSDLLENLEAGGMAAWRGETDRWALMANAVFVGLGATKDGAGNTTADVDVDQAWLEFDGAYRFSNRFEVLFGARGMALDTTVEVRQPLLGSTERNAGKSWVDPVVGARFAVLIGKKWSFVGRGDVGGFGVGSDFTWQAVAHFDWRIGKTVGMVFGYQVLDVDYEDGEGSDLFRFDAAIAGPLVGVTFAF